MSIVGATIDYGPFGFVEHFNKKHICNHSDKEGYYSYENQPRACRQNIQRLTDTLSGVLTKEEGGSGKDIKAVKSMIGAIFDETYEAHFAEKMRAKLGLKEKTEETVSAQ